jgi:hypothetical protein
MRRSFFAGWYGGVARELSLLAIAAAGVAIAAAGPASCAAGTELGTGGSSSSDTVTATVTGPSTTVTGGATGMGPSTGSTTVAATGAGGMGGAGGATATSTASAGGAGGATSSATSTATATSSATSTSTATSSATASSSSSGTGGGMPAGTVLMLAGGGPKVLAGEFHPGGAWATTQLSATTDKDPGLAMTGSNSAVGVIRNTSSANDVAFTTWAPGAFQAFASIQANVVSTQAAPGLVGSGSRADLVFLGNDGKYYYGAHVAAWAPVAEAVKPPGMTPQSFGPGAASIASIGSDSIIAFAGMDTLTYDQLRTGGIWQGANNLGNGNPESLAPSIIALTAGPDMMIAFVRSSDAKILYSTRFAGMWTAPVVIDANSFTNDPVALTALPNGAVVLAFRGLDQKIYFSRYTNGLVPPWSPPAPLASPNFTTPSRPAVAPGVSGADVEMGFINSADGKAYHARLTGLTWSAPVAVGGTMLTTVAIASAP